MKCPTCPLAELARPCLGEGHAPLCAHAVGPESELYRRTLLEHGRPRPSPAPRADGGTNFPLRTPADGRRRVGFVVPVLYSCGAEEQTRQVAASLDPARYSSRGIAILNGKTSTDPSMVGRFGAMMPVGFGRGAAMALARECDILIGWDMGDFPASLPPGPDRPRVACVGHSPGESDWGRQAMARLDGVDAVVAVSELAIETIPESGRSCARVIWNAIDRSRLVVARSRPEMRASWGVPGLARVVLYYGRLSHEKGVDALIRLAAHLPDGWHVVAVGDGGLRPSLMARAADAGLANLHFPGRDPAAGDCLAAADYLVSPSVFESFGLTMGEGLAYGIPLVATLAGLVKLHPELARVIPVDADGPTLAAAILADEADRAGRLDRVARGMAFADDRLSLDRFGREWMRLVDELVPDPARSPDPTVAAKPAYDPWAVDPAIRDRVNGCEHRGPVLPISLQADCGCRGRELSECRAGKGKTPGRVTLRDCFQCQG